MRRETTLLWIRCRHVWKGRESGKSTGWWKGQATRRWEGYIRSAWHWHRWSSRERRHWHSTATWCCKTVRRKRASESWTYVVCHLAIRTAEEACLHHIISRQSVSRTSRPTSREAKRRRRKGVSWTAHIVSQHRICTALSFGRIRRCNGVDDGLRFFVTNLCPRVSISTISL